MENGSARMNDIIVLPTTFGEAFEPGKEIPLPNDVLARAHDRISRYHTMFWSSRLIIVPLQRNHHWVLAVVTNPYVATAQDTVRPPSQIPVEGDIQPDQQPFSILLLNSWVRSPSIDFMSQCLRSYLNYSFNAIQGGELQYVYSYQTKCPRQVDGVSCGLHLIRNAEIMMDLSKAERVRKGAQGVRKLHQIEYEEIFRPAEAASDTQRSIYVASLQQHIRLYESRSKKT
ncbi:hypothetical protein FRC00_004999 [Tulasnella sp. 408]|nr:hypothetical protein FRC00_004999 [Tulasnella sp. 408]